MFLKKKFSLKRYKKNPILKPISKHPWEAKAVFNAGCLYEDGKFHIIYRAMSKDNISTFGYAESRDGFHIDRRLKKPVYVPRASFEARKDPKTNSGCEDPRLVRLGDRIYMFYTAYCGIFPASAAITWIKTDDFLNRKWNWSKPRLISPLEEANKNICIFPEKIKGKYVILHRMEETIDFSYAKDLHFPQKKLGKGNDWIKTRKNKWDSKRIGIAGIPIKTKHGWLLIYHGVCYKEIYYLGALLLSLSNPKKVIARTDKPIFEPKKRYEKKGQVPNVVFSCGSTLLGDTIYVYYGGGDSVIGVATCSLEKLIKEIKK